MSTEHDANEANALPFGSEEEETLSLSRLSEMWEELALLAKGIREDHNQFADSYRTSDLLASAMRRVVMDAAKRWKEGTDLTWNSREEFFAVAATAMHRAMKDHIKRKVADKRRPRGKRLPFDDGMLLARSNPEQLLDIDKCLERLTAIDPRLAEVVRWKVFTPLTHQQIAIVLGVGAATIGDRWQTALAHLGRHLESTSL